MKKILDICKKPDICTYSYHAYLNAILQSGKKNGKELLNVNVMDYQSYEWDFNTTCNFLEIQKDNTLSFLRKGYYEPNEGFLLRRCQQEDDIVVRINRYLPVSLNSIVNLICGERKDGVFTENVVRFGLLGNKKFYIICNNKEIKPFVIEINEFPCWLKIVKQHDRVEMRCSMDGSKWNTVYECKGINWNEKTTNYIGINYNMFDNDYENWKFSNYFQLFLDRNNSVKVDYYNISKRDYGYHYLNQFIRFDYKIVENISQSDFYEYMINLIYEGNYVCMHIDEFYFDVVEKVTKRHYVHSNLLYGIDTDNQLFFALGYNDDGKLCKKTISFENLYKAYMAVNNREYKKVEVMQYCPSRNKYKFEIEYFLLQIKEFLQGENSSLRLAGVLPIVEGEYGIKVYKYLADHPNIMIEDLRIAYLFVERNKLMKERINFLYHRHYLSQEESVDLLEGISKIGESCDRLLYVCMIGNFRGDISLEIVTDKIKKIEEEEIKEYTKLFNILNKFKRREHDD